MKKILIITLLVFTSSFISAQNKIEVIDFYGTHRCETCLEIQGQTETVLNTYFSNELKKGIITFKTVNVDNDKNYSISEEFEATGTALFLNIIKDGKNKKVNLTNFAFLKIWDTQDYYKELKEKIEKELNTL